MNINEASKACGLSPSVLRIWELRYGWPSPKRKPNGYRSYSHHQVQELKRMGELVKAGVPISSLIVEGLPRWPANHPHSGRKQLAAARALRKPADRQISDMQEELFEALESLRGSLVRELLQRCVWQVRPVDEAQAFFVPTLIGLAELRQSQRSLSDEEEIKAIIGERCEQLMRPFAKHADDTLWILPLHPGESALAALVAVLINLRGHAAKPWFEQGLPDGPIVAVSEEGFADLPDAGSRLVGRLSPLGCEESTSLAELIDSDASLSWTAAAV
jgi:DNA-binding transcriptional MerR regulator